MRRKKLTTVVRGGDTREILTALRYKIAVTIEDSESGRDIAALSKQLIEIQKELDDGQPVQTAAQSETVLSLVRKKHKKEA